jgi:hypothetical protein
MKKHLVEVDFKCDCSEKWKKDVAIIKRDIREELSKTEDKLKGLSERCDSIVLLINKQKISDTVIHTVNENIRRISYIEDRLIKIESRIPIITSIYGWMKKKGWFMSFEEENDTI